MKERYENFMDHYYKPEQNKYLKDMTKEEIRYYERLNKGILDYQN